MTNLTVSHPFFKQGLNPGPGTKHSHRIRHSHEPTCLVCSQNPALPSLQPSKSMRGGGYGPKHCIWLCWPQQPWVLVRVLQGRCPAAAAAVTSWRRLVARVVAWQHLAVAAACHVLAVAASQPQLLQRLHCLLLLTLLVLVVAVAACRSHKKLLMAKVTLAEWNLLNISCVRTFCYCLSV